MTNKLFVTERKFNSLSMNTYRGKVVSVSIATLVTGGNTVIDSKIDTTIHVALNDGIQKSINISQSGIHCIEGNEVFFIFTDDDQLIFLHNYASGLSATAFVKYALSNRETGTVLIAISLFILCGVAFYINQFVGFVVLIFSLIVASKLGRVNDTPSDSRNKQFQELLIANNIDLKSCISVLNQA